MPNALTGTLIRERRLALGLRQADLAQAAGISASYLNLIEHNRRRTGAEVLGRLAQALGVESTSLSEGAGGALLDDLRAAVAAAQVASAELDRIDDFASRFPGWAAVLAATQQRAAHLERVVATLNDRLAHDPHLSASLHEVLSSVSSVRSTAAILAESEDIDPEWRARFHHNLHEDSERLAAGAEALVAYLDGSDNADLQGTIAPQDEVEAWLSRRGWQVTELESPGGRERLLGEVADLASAAARDLGAAFVAQAQAEAMALPLAALETALGVYGDDPAMVAQAVGVSVLTAMRRMALRPGSRAGLVICDASGTFLFRKPVDGFSLPRFGAACPLWPLFAALARPMTPIVQIVETAGRAPMLFRAMALCEARLPAGFAGSDLREAGMLLLPVDLSPGGATVTPVGSSCRICPRVACPARREPSIVSDAV
jgi:transcriptional regulator with XRE-family HTH domain